MSFTDSDQQDVNVRSSDITFARNYATQIVSAVEKKMYGMDSVIKLCFVALFAGGHVLLEGNPGLGKTALVKTLSQNLDFDFKRIQFTPDLLPSDITTTVTVNKDGTFHIGNGPIFTSLLLADEINRASPKTQAALLEAMAERQVTRNGTGIHINDYDADTFTGLPFMVLATQNPLEHAGTYELPEAQIDRFMFKVSMPNPDRDVIQKILVKEIDDAAKGQKASPVSQLSHASSEKELLEKRYWNFWRLLRAYEMTDLTKIHIYNLVEASGGSILPARTGRSYARNETEIRKYTDGIKFGLSPRAARDLRLAAQAWALFFTQDENKRAIGTQATGDSLANVVVPVLRHRIQLHYGFLEKTYPDETKRLGGRYSQSLVDRFIRDLCIACVPPDRGYERDFTAAMNNAINR